jgi:hypothetical protein
VTITNLFNTGVGALNAVDTNYVIIAADDPAMYQQMIIDNALSGSLINDATSKWIYAVPSGYTTAYNGLTSNKNYTIRTTFTISGEPSLASIQVKMFNNDRVIAVYLNGNNLSIAGYYGDYWTTPFTMNSGFVLGTNQIDFVLRNITLEAAVRIEYTY